MVSRTGGSTSYSPNKSLGSGVHEPPVEDKSRGYQTKGRWEAKEEEEEEVVNVSYETVRHFDEKLKGGEGKRREEGKGRYMRERNI